MPNSSHQLYISHELSKALIPTIQDHRPGGSPPDHGLTEWNLDGLTDRQLTIMVHRMLMYATICKVSISTDHPQDDYCRIYGQPRGWWDNYMPST
ncbi:hypothetical protein H5410_065096 [Solanum commersonii]|uniref:DUF7746 domain-containing protein n=1 Tax=Solanum commersonii TaxID=4109 RepID=A0A9J5VXH5_SOLCO|nr:hypothetical protein H5410_065096 [Solanum commersonii]